MKEGLVNIVPGWDRFRPKTSFLNSQSLALSTKEI